MNREYLKRKKYYKEQKHKQMISELVSFLIEGDTIGEACDKTMEIFPLDNTFIDVANGYMEVYD